MTTNLFTSLLFIALTAVAAWLTWKAIKARKTWVKIVGGIVGGLFTLIFATLAITGGMGVRAAYFPGADPAPDITVAGTPEQIARGEYIVNLSCIGCHSAVGADGNPTGEHPLSGGWNIAQAEGFGFVGDMVAENLTPGGKLANYSDGEIFRLLRTGINQEGDLAAFMVLMPYRELSDADTEAIIAYLRTLDPVAQSAETGDRLSYIGGVMFALGMFGDASPGPASITAPSKGVSAEYGKYVATFAECRGCHGPDVTGVAPSTADPAGTPNPRPLVSELSQDEFFTMMRSGIKPDGQPFPETMPWEIAAGLTDNDLAALYTYLIATP